MLIVYQCIVYICRKLFTANRNSTLIAKEETLEKKDAEGVFLFPAHQVLPPTLPSLLLPEEFS